MAKKVITGNYAAAYGATVSRAEVISAYPITPQTGVVEKLAELVSNGELDARFVNVESEHSALAVCIAASNTGARTFTATSSQGLLLMHELLHWASAARTPVVIVNVNRATAPPWSVWADHTDSVSQRDTGCLQFYCESNQEVLDTVIQAYRVCEDPEVLLPAIISQDAFYLSHTQQIVDIPDPKLVDKYLPPYNPPYKIDVEKPVAIGSLSMPHQWFPELRYNMAEAMVTARERILRADSDFRTVFGRSWGGLVEKVHCDDADYVLVCAGTSASTAKVVVEKLRKDGHRVGIARLRVFRPFPVDEIRALGKTAKVLAVADRCFTMGYEGPFFTEVKAALYNSAHKPVVKNFILGLGGRDVTPAHIEKIYTNLFQVGKKGLDREVEWVDLKKEG
jgi:2-oxoisovalerate ferredoxin oxidoreductase alpha subunit